MKKILTSRIFVLLLVMCCTLVLIFIYTFLSKNINTLLFEKIPSSDSNIFFSNDLTYTNTSNSYTYNNFYSGGGVALGDINNDGLPDIYFISTQNNNRLYLNKGNFKFEDITEKSKVGGIKPWSTGVSMVDINGDGFLDIYVCNSGLAKSKDRENELFINNGDLTFTERAKDFGIADSGLSTQAVFFDYDKDGDLDMYLSNYTSRPINSFNLKQNLREKMNFKGGDRLYRNNMISHTSGEAHSLVSLKNNSKTEIFTDVTKQAGIYSSEIGFGLGATVGDINKDGWMDIYVSNDFFERDYLYLNNRNGTFREVLKRQMNSISTTSMSGDIADLNNDGYPEIFIADMLPENEKRIKTLADFIDWEQYQNEINMGYYKKFERNMLHYNNGNGTFSEIGRLAGIEATDWSWGGLIADFNLDGLQDIFVPNGIYKDMTNKDVLIKFRKNMRSFIQNGKMNFKKLTELTPTNPLPNYMFENQGDLQFANQAAEWGLAEPSFSNGAAYGDLDGDGDLDLVVNNINMKSFIYRNNSTGLYPKRSWIQIKLEGESPNTFGVGAQIKLVAGGKQWYAEQMLQRGFESSIDPILQVGLGSGILQIDTLEVSWPNGQVNLQTEIKTQQRVVIKQSEADSRVKNTESVVPVVHATYTKDPLLTDITEKTNMHWQHTESLYNDFKRSPLLYNMRSTEGPPLCSEDINNDGLEDFYVGGAAGQPGALFLQKSTGDFVHTKQPILEADRNAEDTDCIFFDADGDGISEIYVASGSDEFPIGSRNLADRLYRFNGQGKLVNVPNALPEPHGGYMPTGVVQAADIDGDGNIDLFVGVRMNPSAYGIPVGGYLLRNDGSGRFKDATDQWAPELRQEVLKSAGITDAKWGDLNKDNTPDLVLAGEWMPLTIFYNKNGRLKRADLNATGLAHTTGWWQSLALKDLNGDGALDLVGGNHGLNSQFHASPSQPVQMWVADFNHNGVIQQIYTTFTKDGGPYPLALRQNLIQQLPYLKPFYPTFNDYAGKKINDIFIQDQLDDAIHYRAEQLASVIGWNKGDGSFKIEPLPFRAQVAPVYSILAEDLDKNGTPELIMGGNLSSVKPQAGPYDASFGLVLQQDSTGAYREVPTSESGFFNRGEIRVIRALHSAGKKLVLVARNNEPLRVFRINKK